MDLRRLRLIAIVIPALFVVGAELARWLVLEPLFVPGEAHKEMGHHIVAGVVTVWIVLVFSVAIFALIERIHRKVLAQNLELAALTAIAGAGQSVEMDGALERSLDMVLEASSADAVELLCWDDRLRRLVPWVGQARGPDATQDLLRLTEALAAPVAEGSQPVFIASLHGNPRAAGAADAAERFGSFASVPLTLRDRTVGVMSIAARRPGVLGPKAAPLLSSVATQMGVILENRRLFQEIGQREREARALNEIGTKVLSSLDSDHVLQSVAEHTRALLGVDVVALCLMDERNGELVMAGRAGPAEAFTTVRTTAAKLPAVEGVAGPCAPCLVPGGEVACAALRPAYRRCHAVVPLRAGERALGALCIGDTAPREFSAREVELLTALANQAAVALSNARLYEKSQYTAILEERDRIAREMHDSLAQVLGFVAMKARGARAGLGPDQVAAGQHLDEIAEVAEEAYTDVREAILGLRESVAPDIGLAGALAQYLQKFTRQSGIAAKLVHGNGAVLRFPPEAEVQLVRIIQEALTNVRKHSGARQARVRFDLKDESARISIEDDGRGFDPSHRPGGTVSGFGMQTMAERAERIGGMLEVDSAPGKGTRVRVLLPAAHGGTDG